MKMFLFCFSAVVGLACRCGAEGLGSCHSAVSPDGKNEIRVWAEKELAYGVFRDGRELVPRSVISLTLDGRAPLGPAARVKDVERRILSGTLPTPIGKQAVIDLSGNETRIVMEGSWALRLVARNDGVAYRFETSVDGKVRVLDEQATVGLSGRCSVAYVNYDRGGWKEGGDFEQDSWEAVTRVQAPCEVGTTNGVAYLPVVFGFADGTALSVTESDLHDYAGWLLQRDASSVRNPLVARFSRFPLATINVNWKESDDSVKRPLRYKRVTKRADFIVETDGTRTYPWRVFQIAPRAIDLCASQIVEALATPAREDFSWVEPGQVAWDWWNAFDNKGTKDGCTTAGYRRFIDFAARHGIRYVILDEGWSKALDIWEYAPNVDVPEIVRYAEQKGVGIILWMAAGQVIGQEEKVAAHFGALGVKGFKVDFMDREDADMIRFEESFAAACAHHRLVVAYHGMSKPTGLHVTYPNILNYEGVHGLENMKWYNGKEDFMLNDLMSLYVRMSAGPMDYTPGAMDNYPVGAYRGTYKEPGSMGTRCRQMALMILCYAPLQMLCDAPTKYERNPESFGFMSQVPTVWDETVGLDGDPTRFAVLARRKGADWWCAGIASKEGKSFELDTGFRGSGRWRATIFRDAEDAALNPASYVREVRTVRAGERLRLDMAGGGGFAVRFARISASDE